MKRSSKTLTILMALLVLSACNSQSAREQKYNAILSEAENSSIIELETPDGFKFDMTESEFDEAFAQRESHFTDSLLRCRYSLLATYDWPLGTEHYAVGKTYSRDFQDDKLCSYEIGINGRIANDKFVLLRESDINTINDYYKAFLEKDYTFDSLNLEGEQIYVFT